MWDCPPLFWTSLTLYFEIFVLGVSQTPHERCWLTSSSEVRLSWAALLHLGIRRWWTLHLDYMTLWLSFCDYLVYISSLDWSPSNSFYPISNGIIISVFLTIPSHLHQHCPAVIKTPNQKGLQSQPQNNTWISPRIFPKKWMTSFCLYTWSDGGIQAAHCTFRQHGIHRSPLTGPPYLFPIDLCFRLLETHRWYVIHHPCNSPSHTWSAIMRLSFLHAKYPLFFSSLYLLFSGFWYLLTVSDPFR